MTLVETRYKFITPFKDEFTEAIQRAHSTYGLRSVKLDNKLEGLTVQFDASRLTIDDVDEALRRLALPVVRDEA